MIVRHQMWIAFNAQIKYSILLEMLVILGIIILPEQLKEVFEPSIKNKCSNDPFLSMFNFYSIKISWPVW